MISTLEGDVLLGCDGIHSAARHLWVEPTREKEYSGRAVTMGWAYNAANQAKDASSSTVTMPSGEPALRDTAAFSTTGGTMIASFYEPTRQDIFVAHVRKMAEQSSSGQGGWQLLGKDQEAVKKEVMDVYSGGRINGLQDTIARCEDWHVYPIYALPPKGLWHRGRVLLLGDAAHAVSIFANRNKIEVSGRGIADNSAFRCLPKAKAPVSQSKTAFFSQEC